MPSSKSVNRKEPVARLEITAPLDANSVEALYLEIRQLALHYGIPAEDVQVEVGGQPALKSRRRARPRLR